MFQFRRLAPLRRAMMATCSGLALALSAPHALAAPLVSVSYGYTIEGGPLNSFADTSTSGLSTYPGDSAGGSYINGAHWGYVNGVFGTRSSGSGNFANAGSSSWSDSFTNGGSVPVSLVASFMIEQGQVSVFGGGTGQVAAGVSARIAVDATDVFYSAADIVMVDGGLSALTKTGTALDPGTGSMGFGSGYYYWGSYYGTIDMGLVAPGATVNIGYILESYASSNVTGCGGYGYGYGYGYGCSTEAIGRIGDPINIGQTSDVAFAFNANEVATPEPATAALLGAGLAGLVLRRRRAAQV